MPSTSSTATPLPSARTPTGPMTASAGRDSQGTDSIVRYGWIQLPRLKGFNCRVWKDLAARLRRIQLPALDGNEHEVEVDEVARYGLH